MEEYESNNNNTSCPGLIEREPGSSNDDYNTDDNDKDASCPGLVERDLDSSDNKSDDKYSIGNDCNTIHQDIGVNDGDAMPKL